jgi:hypothetical protein
VNNFTWKKYIYLLLSFSTNKINPYINPFFLINLHKKNKIDIFHIDTIIILNKVDLTHTTLIIKYQPKQLIKYTNKIYNMSTDTENYFHFPSFNLDTHKEQIKNELTKLYTNRDKYDTIHINLMNNGGGSVIPGELLVKCLLGSSREPWMKTVRKIDKNGIHEWDIWSNADSPNQNQFKLLNLDLVPIFDTKYMGKIHLYMNELNTSAAWYTITYLIYGFGNKIKRYNKKCYGYKLKLGKIPTNSNLILHGRSSTCSGDGNSTLNKFSDIFIQCPTMQFYNRSFDIIDWNRYWLEN